MLDNFFEPNQRHHHLPAVDSVWQSMQPAIWHSYWALYDFLPWVYETEAHVCCVPVHSERVVIQRFRPPTASRGCVVILHGYMDHIGLYRHLIADLIEQGFVVYGFDLQGHGLSSGAPYAIDNFGDYVDALNAVLGVLPQRGPRILIGQSTGGAIILEHHRRMGARIGIDQRILLAPLIRPRHLWRIRLHYALMHRFLRHVPRVYRGNSHDPRFLSLIRDHDPLAHHHISVKWVGAMLSWVREFEKHPIALENGCVIQGTHDETVDWQYNIDYLRPCIMPENIHLVEQAQHHLVNELPVWRQPVFQQIRAYLAQY